MKVFLIILAVLVVLTAIILSLSAELTVVYDKGWSTCASFLFIEKDIELSKILSFLLFPQKVAEDVAEKHREEKKDKAADKGKNKSASKKADSSIQVTMPESSEQKKPEEKKPDKTSDAPQKPNPIQKIWQDEGFLGIMLLVSNLMQTAGSALSTLIKGLHIYSLYVKMIIGGGDAADIGNAYGTVCGIYYPLKGAVLSGMKVDQYDDLIEPDFIAPSSEYEFQVIVSINVALLLRVALKAVKVFLVNLIKNR